MWDYQRPYATFRFNDDGTLDMRVLCARDLMSNVEKRGVLTSKQLDALYAMPHTLESPATMDVIHKGSGRGYRVVRADLLKVCLVDAHEEVKPKGRRASVRIFRDVASGYEWPFYYVNYSNPYYKMLGASDGDEKYYEGKDPVTAFQYHVIVGGETHLADGTPVYCYALTFEQCSNYYRLQPANNFDWARLKNVAPIDMSLPVSPAEPVSPAFAQQVIASVAAASAPAPAVSAAAKPKKKSKKPYVPRRSEAEVLESVKDMQFKSTFGDFVFAVPPANRHDKHVRIFKDATCHFNKDWYYTYEVLPMAKESNLPIVCAPSKHYYMMNDLGLFDGYDEILFLSGLKKTDAKDLRAYGYNVIYIAGEDTQATPELEQYHVVKSYAVWDGSVSDELMDTWATEKLVHTLWDAAKNAKSLVRMHGYDGYEYTDVVDVFTCGRGSAVAKKYLSPKRNNDIASLLNNEMDYREEYFKVYDLPKYDFCEMMQAPASEVAEVEECARLIKEAFPVWASGLVARRKKSAFMKLAEHTHREKQNMLAMGEECGIIEDILAL